jgi:3-hydroxyacyl-CoA dehydrogenase
MTASSALVESGAPPKPLVELVEQGHLGRRTGKGFHDWSEETV